MKRTKRNWSGFLTQFAIYSSFIVSGCLSQTLIDSKPTGAKVLIDDEIAGETPLVFQDRPTIWTSHQIQVDADGYHPITAQIRPYKWNGTRAVTASALTLGTGLIWAVDYRPSYLFILPPYPAKIDALSSGDAKLPGSAPSAYQPQLSEVENGDNSTNPLDGSRSGESKLTTTDESVDSSALDDSSVKDEFMVEAGNAEGKGENESDGEGGPEGDTVAGDEAGAGTGAETGEAKSLAPEGQASSLVSEIPPPNGDKENRGSNGAKSSDNTYLNEQGEENKGNTSDQGGICNGEGCQVRSGNNTEPNPSSSPPTPAPSVENGIQPGGEGSPAQPSSTPTTSAPVINQAPEPMTPPEAPAPPQSGTSSEANTDKAQVEDDDFPAPEIF